MFQPVEDLMLSSIHAFSVELRLASESVLGKVKYVTAPIAFFFGSSCCLGNASLLCNRFWDRHTPSHHEQSVV